MLKKVILIFCSLLLFTACTRPQKEQAPDMFWPMPPSNPRIQFLDIIVGSIDVAEDGNKFSTLLFGENSEASFLKPNFIAARSDIIYITDISGVHIYDFKKKQYRLYKAGLSSGATGIDVDSKGNIYVADAAARKIIIFDRKGKLKKTITDVKNLSNMGGLFVDEVRDRFLVANTRKHKIEVFSLAGEHMFNFGTGGNGPGQFNYPYDVLVDKDGNIVVLDSGNFRVQIFDTEGNFKGTFGSVGTAPGHFARPKSIALSSDEHLFVMDSAFGNFQIFNKRGEVMLAVGRTGRQLAEFMLPMGIAIDENDKIYIVDQINRRLQVFQYITYPEK